jgi:hypothetical protein
MYLDFSYLICTLCFSSAIIELWGHGCTGLPSSEVDALNVGVRVWPVDPGPAIVHSPWPAMHYLISMLAVLKQNRLIRNRTNANCSSFQLRVFLGLSNLEGQRQTSILSIPHDNLREQK